MKRDILTRSRLLYPLCGMFTALTMVGLLSGCSGEPTDSPTPETPTQAGNTPTATPGTPPTSTPEQTTTPTATAVPIKGAPALEVLTPTDGQVINVGQAVGFSVLVTDDEPVSALTVAIFSSLDGTLYSGAPATGGVVAFSKVLSPGIHLLTFTVEDADGLSDVLTQQLRLNQSPSVELLAPKEGDSFSRTSPVKVQARVTDPDDASSTLQALILSSADGIVAEPTIDSAGYIRAELTELSGGEHLLEVQVTDPHQAQDSSQVTITINPCSGEDLDQDGYSSDPACSVKDCNDEDDTIYPGASEVCNGIDEDCDGKADEGVTSTWYKDNDGDGYGASSSGTTQACTPPSGYSATSTDCNDTVSTINPSAAEICNGKDDNCDGKSDDGQGITYYRDADGDGYGDASVTTTGCNPPTGYVSRSGDCDDTKNAINPGAAEICNGIDDNCDGQTDPGLTSTYYRDADGDGYGSASSSVQACSQPSGYSSVNTDCDDVRADVNPGAVEVCNSRDDNCDGKSDNGVSIVYYQDADGDGYGISSSTVNACAPPAGYASKAGDCNDNNGSVNPGVTESCNSLDDNCNGSTDEGVTSTFYKDVDADAHGSSASGTTQACTLPSGYARTNDDCNDADASIHADASETCDGKDNNCDADIDEPFDTDHDGITTCASTPDCNDTDANVFPGASESCNLKDDDCDSAIDEGFDQDQDGYKTCGTNADCDDTNGAIHPGATETCDGKDNNCDGSIDTGIGTTYYVDADKDGYGSSQNPISACSMPSGYAAVSGDCNDSDASIKPGASESCNSKDDDCDGSTDEGLTTAYYPDADLDGYGLTTGVVNACSAPAGYITTAGDCNDSDATIKPGASETCNSKDDNCDGIVDNLPGAGTFYRDLDNDGYGMSSSGVISACTKPSGYSAFGSDCDDANNAKYPGATDTCGDGVDANCDGRDACTVTANTSMSTGAVATIRGGSTNEFLGYAPALVGDVDGDGFDDLLVSAHYNDAGGTDAGAAYLFLGPVTGSSLTASNADAVLLGEQASDYAGFSVAGAGDVNGDGYADLLIGAYYNDKLATNAGAAYVVYGPVTGVVRLSNADVRLYGVASADYFGQAVDGGADFNGDGFDDFVIGAPSADANSRSNSGCVYLFLGSANLSGQVGIASAKATFCGSAASENVGMSVSLGADIDGDAKGDLLFGGPGYDSSSGAVYYISSTQNPSGALDLNNGTSYKARFTGDLTSGRLGGSVDHGGDITGDGVVDLIMGASSLNTSYSYSGAAYVVPGGVLTGSTKVGSVPGVIKLNGDCVSDYFGSRVASVGDLNHDGFDDFAVGAEGADSSCSSVYYRGYTYVFFGPMLSPLTPGQGAISLSGTADYFYGGALARGAGDLNGDGYDDLVMGEPQNTGAYIAQGALYVWNGPLIPWSRRSSYYPLYVSEQQTSYAGRMVASAGDVDGDGLKELLIGSPEYNEGTSVDAGTVWLVSGSKTLKGGADKLLTSAKARFLAQAPGDALGTSAAGVGDVNGDGYGDFVLGAPLQDEAGTDAGAVYLVLGPVSGSIQVANVKARFLGEKAGDQAGSSVAALGDMNKDGYADFAIGAEKYDDGSKKDTGAVYVIFGSPSWNGVISLSSANARWVGELNYDYAGGAVSGPGDVNGDGTPDMLIGARENDGSAIDAGAAYLVFGPVTGVKNLSTANVKFRGAATLDYSGWSVTGLGDTNGDGKADFAIGAPGADPSSRTDGGRVYVVLGAASYASPVGLGSASIVFAGDGAGDAFGRSISGGDVNGDGAGDLVVGAPGLDVPGHTEGGGLYILLASRTGFATGEKKALDAAWNRFVGMNGDGGGPAVVVVGDMTGDFAAEVAVGFPGYDTSTTTQHGAVMVVPWRYLGP